MAFFSNILSVSYPPTHSLPPSYPSILFHSFSLFPFSFQILCSTIPLPFLSYHCALLSLLPNTFIALITNGSFLVCWLMLIFQFKCTNLNNSMLGSTVGRTWDICLLDLVTSLCIIFLVPSIYL